MGGHGSDINGGLELAQLVLDSRADYVYDAGLGGGHKYLIWFTKDYYLQLTGGTISAEDFIGKTFDFLKAKQAFDKMPAEFDFASIRITYPDYEDAMQGKSSVANDPAPAGTPPVAPPVVPADAPAATLPVAPPVIPAAAPPVIPSATPPVVPVNAPLATPIDTPAPVSPTGTPQAPTL